MPSIDPNATLADLVTAYPGLASKLDRLRLDYCCGGQSRLVEAVEASELDLDDVLASLASVKALPDGADWAAMGPAELVDHVEATHHVYLRDALPRLAALVDKVCGVHGERHPELHEVRSLFGALRADLEPHLMNEERVLFPMVRQLAEVRSVSTFDEASLVDSIRVIAAEHDTAGDLLARLRSATNDHAVPDDGCASYRALYAGLAELEADTHLHVHKENNLLFPAVLESDDGTTQGPR